jgi:hypothetical protein
LLHGWLVSEFKFQQIHLVISNDEVASISKCQLLDRAARVFAIDHGNGITHNLLPFTHLEHSIEILRSSGYSESIIQGFLERQIVYSSKIVSGFKS